MHAKTDAELIAEHGGPAALARKLGYATPHGTQRVSNWIRRGIPPAVKLEHMELFGVQQVGGAGNAETESSAAHG